MLLILGVDRLDVVVSAEVARDRTGRQLVERLTTQVLATLKKLFEGSKIVLEMSDLILLRLTDILVEVRVDGWEGQRRTEFDIIESAAIIDDELKMGKRDVELYLDETFILREQIIDETQHVSNLLGNPDPVIQRALGHGCGDQPDGLLKVLDFFGAQLAELIVENLLFECDFISVVALVQLVQD